MGQVGDKGILGLGGVYSDEFLRGARLGSATVIYSVRAALKQGWPEVEIEAMLDGMEAGMSGWTNESTD